MSLALDKLHLFGHAVLEINAPQDSRPALVASLEALPHVSVEDSKTQENQFVVTVDMPYPDRGRPEEAVGWNTFQRNDLSSSQATEPRVRTTARHLPTLQILRDTVAQRNASLKDVRWSVQYACRAQGGVALAPANLPAGRWTVAFANGVTETCDISNADGGQALVEEPQRRSRGTVDAEGSALLLTFADDRVERWTPVGRRFVVEHWCPAAAFPAGAPVLGIAERSPSSP